MFLKHLLNTNAVDCVFGKIEQFVSLHLLSDRATPSDLIYMIQRAKHYKCVTIEPCQDRRSVQLGENVTNSHAQQP